MLDTKKWLKTKVTIPANSTIEVVLHNNDFIPNVAQFRNNENAPIFMNSDSPLFDLVNNDYEFIISGGATRVYVNPRGFEKIFLFSQTDTSIIINYGFDNDLKTYDLDETTITQFNTVNVAPIVEVSKISQSLPAGDNNIGNVDVVSMPILPAGDNNIGNVDISTMPVAVLDTTQYNAIIQLLTDIKTNTTPA